MDTLDSTVKADAHTLSIVKTTSATVSASYTLTFLREQRAAILAQQARDNAQREAELAGVDQLIAECAKLGIVEATKASVANGPVTG